MSTLDVWRSGNELTVIVSGATAAPTVTNLDSGIITTLRPARVDHFVPGHATAIIDALPSTPHGDWWGEVPIDGTAGQVQLEFLVDGVPRSGIVRWEA
jgi:hypothetical protein